MSLSNLEEFAASLLDAQFVEIQILEEENKAKVQQRFNASTYSVCNKDAKDKYISCIECHSHIHYR